AEKIRRLLLLLEFIYKCESRVVPASGSRCNLENSGTGRVQPSRNTQVHHTSEWALSGLCPGSPASRPSPVHSCILNFLSQFEIRNSTIDNERPAPQRTILPSSDISPSGNTYVPTTWLTGPTIVEIALRL